MADTLDRELEELLTREQVEEGDHEKFSHYAPKNAILESALTGKPVRALCGKLWVPDARPGEVPGLPDLQRDLREARLTVAKPDANYLSDLYIDGVWRAGSEGKSFAVIDPSDGSEITEFAIATQADCIAAVDAAAAAFPGWAATAPRVRGELLRAAFEILRTEREQFAEIIVRENGKAFPDALAEADYSMEFFRWFSEEAVRIGGEFRLSPNGDKRIIVTHQPIGVSLLITPWNFPAAMATRKLGPALAAGCTTVLKPARETPLTAAYMVGCWSARDCPRVW